MYPSLYCKGSKRVIQGFTVRGSWRPNRTAIYWPPLLWPSALCLSRSPGLLNRRPRGSAFCWVLAFSTTSCQQLLWTQTQSGPWVPLRPGVAFPTTSRLELQPWLLVLTELYNSSTSTSIAHINPWNSMFDRHQAEITVLQFTGHSLPMHQSMSVPCDFFFTLSHFISQIPPTQFLSITGHWDVSLPSGASLWNGIFARVEGQNTAMMNPFLWRRSKNIYWTRH